MLPCDIILLKINTRRLYTMAEEKKVVKRAKAFSATIGSMTYRVILLKLNKWRKQTNQNSITIEIKEVAGTFESWLTFGANSILLLDGYRTQEEVMAQVIQLRKYLLERNYKVYIQE